MRVLMFGWEFPPYSSGGLGTACYGLTKGLAHHGASVTFVVPTKAGSSEFVKLLSAADFPGKSVRIKGISSPITAYMTSEEYEQVLDQPSVSGKAAKKVYGKNLWEEVLRYAARAGSIAKREPHDVIHAHDWLTYKAGIAAKKSSGKPLVIHVHATEFDRGGGNGVNQGVYDIEKEGMHSADRIIAVSGFTKGKIVEHYGIPPEKVEVVHNAVEFTNPSCAEPPRISEHDRVVLFLGRVTLQKGPDYFLYTARKVLDHMSDVKFVVGGKGDMLPQMIEKAAELGIADRVLFTGFVADEDLDRVYRMADLYVMPSVSEPFGITPLEAMRNGTPVMISKTSGVSEVITHCLKADFWDIDDMASKIIATLHYSELHQTLKEHGSHEVTKFDWRVPARRCIDVYNKLLC
ncbi:glycosyltransferase [Candidatus Woesearchaeota archaeon]|nr:glycosyltransferase [Candidatus Woesearchaeota archaeon]